MKKYEYKFVKLKIKWSFDAYSKIAETEKLWKELGEQGWEFCKMGDGVAIFIREKEG